MQIVLQARKRQDQRLSPRSPVRHLMPARPRVPDHLNRVRYQRLPDPHTDRLGRKRLQHHRFRRIPTPILSAIAPIAPPRPPAAGVQAIEREIQIEPSIRHQAPPRTQRPACTHRPPASTAKDRNTQNVSEFIDREHRKNKLAPISRPTGQLLSPDALTGSHDSP